MNLKKTACIVIFISGLLLAFSCAPVTKAPAILVLFPPQTEPTFLSFKKEMASLQYYEGKNISYVLAPSLTMNEEELKLKGTAMLGQNPDMILSLSTPGTRAALAITRGHPLPIVFGQVSTLEGISLTSETERERKNITGITAAVPITKQLEYLKRLSPKTGRVLLAYTQDPLPLPLVARLREVAPALGIELVERQIRDAGSLRDLLDSLKPGEVNAILQVPDTVGSSNIPLFASAALRLKIPLGVSLQNYTNISGVLFSYSLDPEEHGKEVASLMSRVLKGIPPSRIPIDSPKKYYLTINLQTAREIGLEVPLDMLSLADRLIKDSSDGR